MKRTLQNIAERKFLGNLLLLLSPAIRISIIEWAETYRILSSEESYHVGKFDCNRIPALEYVYDCMYNRFIYTIVAMKASQVGWSELTNNFIGWMIHTCPGKMQWAFPGREPSRIYSREKLKPFFDGTKVLRDIINIGVAKESFNYFKFPGGWLKLTTLGAIGNAKSSSVATIGVEEPDDVKDDVKGQGDTLENVKGRQKTFPLGFKKLIFGGTPTDKDFSRVESGYKQSNQLVFKAQCHLCNELSELSTNNIKYDEYQDRYIDDIYGKFNPETAYYECPVCLGIWTFEDKNRNIINGKSFGFTDFTGKFSKGWHPQKPEIIETFGFHIPELLSTLSSSTYIELAKKKILADIALAKGNESLIKSYINNSDGLPYASGITSMEADEMKLLRKNYPEHICPMEGLVLTAGIDVQDNRFAIVVRAWGRNNNSWLVTWKEIFGDVKVQEMVEGKFVGIWGELSDYILSDISHASGKTMKIHAISIDSGDNTELVYKWVLEMNKYNPHILATKGVRDLRFSDDEIYRVPALADVNTDVQIRKSLAETMGVTVFILGAHRAHTEILNRLMLNKNKDAKSNIYYFNEQSYGQYEEQMTSCRKLIDINAGYNKTIYKLIAGKRKEAMDAEKNALHASYAIGIRHYTHDMWKAIENYFYN
jgi:phage terminase large subunit GpA-like protein